MDDDEDDEDAGASASKPIRTKNEMELPPIEDLDIQIPSTAHLTPIGEIFALIDTTIVIESSPTTTVTLDADSILCTKDRKVIGKVFETFGPVVKPMYSVRCTTTAGLTAGEQVFYVEEMAKYVFAAQLRLLKGSDASNRDDEEVGAEEMEFSDDEQEMEYRRALKQEKRLKRKGNDESEEDDPYHTDNAESMLAPHPRTHPRGGGSVGGSRGTRGGRGASSRGGHRDDMRSNREDRYQQQPRPTSTRGGGFDSRNGPHNPHQHPSNSRSSQPPPSRPAAKIHGLPPKPQPSNTTALPPPPNMFGAPPPTREQILAMMHHQQLQMQQQHQHQLMLATAALQRNNSSGGDASASSPTTPPSAQAQQQMFNPMMMMMGGGGPGGMMNSMMSMNPGFMMNGGGRGGFPGMGGGMPYGMMMGQQQQMQQGMQALSNNEWSGEGGSAAPPPPGAEGGGGSQ
ncbi:hypothetical protein HDU98_002392 [Podochytrium sp. JEL0797]|nr:hypothetical protein HDU98_002392 [Podochytrium sp. JEL0797]